MSQVVYLMSGNSNLPYLLTSLCTLRNHWTGIVKVFAYPEKYSFGGNGKEHRGSYNLVERIAEDYRLHIQPVLWEPLDTDGKNNQFINKIQMLRTLDRTSIYLDADTTIHADISELGELANQCGFVATQFNRWNTSGRLVQNRIKCLYKFDEDIPKKVVQACINPPYFPSVNGGILACRPSSRVLPVWHKWSYVSRSIFISDECVLHLMQHIFSNLEYCVALGGEWNCSHKYRDKSKIKHEDVKIYHYHGDSAVRPDKSPKAALMWWKLFNQCKEMNLGGVNEWLHQCEKPCRSFSWVTD